MRTKTKQQSSNNNMENYEKNVWKSQAESLQIILKSGSDLPKIYFIIWFNDKMKNAFYFILKALFVLKIFKFLS